MSLKVTHPRKPPQSSHDSPIFTYNVSPSLQSSRSNNNSNRNLSISFPVRPNKPTPTYRFQSIAADNVPAVNSVKPKKTSPSASPSERKVRRTVTKRSSLREESSIEQRLDVIWRFFLAFVLELMGVWFLFIMAPYRFSVTTFRTVGKLIAVGPVLSV
ncbi:9890_t:CDS:1 [Paraglomus brasilianum]|uniref:9890_t:CDS:1 n=1 Tax=Paraglomus brasilianum TaxID=144538 RepID=A0A9N8WDB7_9GLOM|nr:9890_t:CDS:1 [Paraglomus brasilianum]